MSNQARNQLRTPEVAKSFLKGAHIFQTMSNSFQLYPKDFSLGGRKGLQGRLRTLSPGYGSVSNSLKYVQHIFTGGPKIFLACYGSGFAP